MVSPEVAAITITLAVHIAGALVLIAAMFQDDEDRDLFGGWWPKDDPGPQDPPPAPPAPGTGIDVPLDDAGQSRRRLRGPGRIGEWRRRRRRRPEHVPAPVPDRDRERH
jgi:hypothetical protein